jgi:hypothetical protein
MRLASWPLSLAVLALAAGATRTGAAPYVRQTGPFGVNCVGVSQLCDPPYAVAIGDAAKTIKVKKIIYTASAAHCSAGRLRVLLDGVEVGKMRFVIGRERSVLRKRIRVSPGAHTLAFQFEGKTGGCNGGAVSGWGGDILVKGRIR